MVGVPLQVRQEGTPARAGQGNDLNNANDLIPVLFGGAHFRVEESYARIERILEKAELWLGQVVPAGVNEPPQDPLVGCPGCASATEFLY